MIPGLFLFIHVLRYYVAIKKFDRLYSCLNKLAGSSDYKKKLIGCIVSLLLQSLIPNGKNFERKNCRSLSFVFWGYSSHGFFYSGLVKFSQSLPMSFRGGSSLNFSSSSSSFRNKMTEPYWAWKLSLSRAKNFQFQAYNHSKKCWLWRKRVKNH